MPRPREVVPGPLPPRRRSPNEVVDNEVVDGCCGRLAAALARLPPRGLTVRFDIRQPPKPVPTLADDYSYVLRCGDETLVRAETEWGGLAALATLAQLVVAEPSPVAEVRDAPRFPWRGLMVDPARRFLSIATLRRTLDAMWFYKLNVLHLHLTDDQGFRFRSRIHPELASAQAYSPEELRDLVAYAADRGVRVVPELDMPGHTTSWLAARPQWGGDERVGASARFGLHRASLDLGNRGLLAAVDDLLGELAETFADDFLHFGGDEAVGVSADDQARFTRRVIERLERLGKRPVGWDECLHPDLPTRTVVQAWRGMGARDAAVRGGYDCVVSAPYYLDLFYPAEVHYAFDPVDDCGHAAAAMRENPRLAHVREGIDWLADATVLPNVPARAPGAVLGGEACMWGELVSDDLLATRVWSRMPAIAERLWGTAGPGDPLPRLIASRRALAAFGILPEDGAALAAYADLAPLIEMLEPVKWYRRLLGDANFTRRANGLGGDTETRPYDATTPLNRPVDRIAPESWPSRRAEADWAAGRSMRRWIGRWRAQRAALDQHPTLQADLGAASAALATIADIVAGESHADPTPLAGPFGEYLLPIAYAVGARR